MRQGGGEGRATDEGVGHDLARGARNHSRQDRVSELLEASAIISGPTAATSNTVTLVAIQILDGVGAGIFGVVSVLVIADLTQGSGRFNVTLGAIGTAVGIGAALSQTIAGTIVHHFSFDAGFLFLAAIAATAFSILYLFMPETREQIFLNENL